VPAGKRDKKLGKDQENNSLFFDNGKMRLLTFAKAVRLSWVLGIFSFGVHLE
jgi:hypothetical protein